MARWIDLDRLLRRDGAIRLPLSSADVDDGLASDKSPLADVDSIKLDEEELPFVLDGEQAAREGYTSASAFPSPRPRSSWR